MFDQFFESVIFLKSLMSFFVTLILKVDSPLELGDFRLVSFIRSLYKLVARVFASTLARVMNSPISQE